MFSKLAFQNVRRSLKDYSVYFLTLTFGVCIFYVFNSMESQYVMEILLSANKGMIRVILQLIDVVSVFVSVVLGFLILYANGFMIRRRKKHGSRRRSVNGNDENVRSVVECSSSVHRFWFCGTQTTNRLNSVMKSDGDNSI